MIGLCIVKGPNQLLVLMWNGALMRMVVNNLVSTQVRAAKKIKEKHAIWQEIGEEYNKFCVK